MPNNSYTAAKAVDDYKDFAYFMNTTPEQRERDRVELQNIRRVKFVGEPRRYVLKKLPRVQDEMADLRRKEIVAFHQQGYSKKEIATRCNCSVRLVELRLKEARE